MKSTIKYLVKIFFAGLIAFAILSAFCSMYYNIPVKVKSTTYSTDHKWESNKFYSRGTEGFACGTTDANGYNNTEIPENINVLVMGSSHMEAFNVMPDQNATYVLNKLFKENNSSMKAYNIGISGHAAEHCFNNIENAVAEFSPSDYIVIEILKTSIPVNNMLRLLNDEYSRMNVVDSGLLYQLYKYDYLRLLYMQYDAYKEQNAPAKAASAQNKNEINKKEYEYYLNLLFEKIAKAPDENCKIIILLNQKIEVDENNNVKSRDEEDYYYKTLKQTCENNGIIFLDMHDAFADYYTKNHTFPHGFSNSRIGEGHLNKYGHNIIAETLYDLIAEAEVK